jgi:hypothetical protein
MQWMLCLNKNNCSVILNLVQNPEKKEDILYLNSTKRMTDTGAVEF